MIAVLIWIAIIAVVLLLVVGSVIAIANDQNDGYERSLLVGFWIVRVLGAIALLAILGIVVLAVVAGVIPAVRS